MLSRGLLKLGGVGALARRGFSSAPPHGGVLVDRMIKDEAEKEDIAKQADVTVELNDRQSCDTELLMNGGFSPLEGFMNSDVYEHVVENMRLPGSNLLFGLPVVMDTNREDLTVGKKVLLTYNGDNIATLDIEDRYVPDKPKETLKCYGTSSIEHPGVRMVAMERGNTYLGGKVTGLNLPKRVFPCETPQEVRAKLPSKDGKDVVAFQCRNPIHRAHYELFTRALDAPNVDKENGGVVLVHPTCGPTQEDDIPGEVRYKTYTVLGEETKDPRVIWSYLPYSMHMAGPREAIQHMMIRKNYGCTHFIIGRDMAGSKSSVTGEDFYGPYDAQDFAKEHAAELGMDTVPSLNLVYTEEADYITADKAEELGYKPVKLSGTEFRRKLRAGEDIPEWFAFKSVVEVLRKHV
uniref:sulfate adenylyltransferase n=1 Tax=Mucochytrium quahogii TaxID=96639 RepID=A0A7S2RB62_9STRA|mmetsp:Transcript_8936/g.14533  ORF Transcript_8936/g.14533 Transcript_8936/m.14533 type:complete len:406 (+) Transcript_8936:69-1286(+)|eukprot:CAMPEP_0203745380 /NCGR_PEP_ID=MMETSP0098-20131031/1134_1 /ASSEMBLY_ACC=CAM_ASM_000208 /TAXON_ID=96639 /ORGANISM=" , Strain NY0313808BC1" /LENGTH=405 /DNA_ID=CAMNT_0050633137 /DNA_START=55 /DNA_END=1272 /DNA_ORIENTATION=-